MVPFTQNVKKIKGAAKKNSDVDRTCKRALSHWNELFLPWFVSGDELPGGEGHRAQRPGGQERLRYVSTMGLGGVDGRR